MNENKRKLQAEIAQARRYFNAQGGAVQILPPEGKPRQGYSAQLTMPVGKWQRERRQLNDQ